MEIPEAFRGIWKGIVEEDGQYALANPYPCEIVIRNSKIVVYYQQSRITAWSEPYIMEVRDAEIRLDEPRCKRINGDRIIPCNKAGGISLTVTNAGLYYRWANSNQVCTSQLTKIKEVSTWVKLLNMQIAELRGSAP